MTFPYILLSDHGFSNPALKSKTCNLLFIIMYSKIRDLINYGIELNWMAPWCSMCRQICKATQSAKGWETMSYAVSNFNFLFSFFVCSFKLMHFLCWKFFREFFSRKHQQQICIMYFACFLRKWMLKMYNAKILYFSFLNCVKQSLKPAWVPPMHAYPGTR